MFSKEACESGPLFYTTPFSSWDIFYCASIAIAPNAQAPLKNFALSFHSAVLIFHIKRENKLILISIGYSVSFLLQ